jgi:hypothetical protein
MIEDPPHAFAEALNSILLTTSAKKTIPETKA